MKIKTHRENKSTFLRKLSKFSRNFPNFAENLSFSFGKPIEWWKPVRKNLKELGKTCFHQIFTKRSLYSPKNLNLKKKKIYVRLEISAVMFLSHIFFVYFRVRSCFLSSCSTGKAVKYFFSHFIIRTSRDIENVQKNSRLSMINFFTCKIFQKFLQIA